MIKCFFFLISAFTFLIGNVSTGAASYSFPIDTHNTPIELKPISFENSYKTASVCFMGFGDCDPKTDYGIDPNNQCSQEGYIKNNCSSVQEPTDYCPYNKAYIKDCKCKTSLITCPAGQVGVGASCGGKYASCQCDPNLKSCAANQVGSGASCGGRYQNCSCKSEYQFTSSNCGSPRSVSGSSCGGKYNNCVCPSGVSTGSYGCKEYYPSPCSSVCKIAKSDNCDKRTAVQTPYGCMSYFADCPSKCERAYPDNCRNRTAVTCQFGCASNWGDCSSKCQSCKNDNCVNKTAVSIPTNGKCVTYFSDCSSKCSDWSCNAGFTYWCAAPVTDCGTLGYNKIASDCSGKYIKCPFDTSKVFCKK